MTNNNNSALKRIQMANVYRHILENGALDGTESTIEDILDIVEIELIAFATSRLEVLMGMRNEEDGPIVVPQSESPFSSDEIEALKQLASTILNRQPQQETQTFVVKNNIQQAQPVQPVQPVQEVKPTTKRRRKRVPQIGQQNQTAGLVENPTSDTPMAGVQKDADRPLYSQNASPSVKSIPMPSQMEIDAKNAREVNRHASNFGVDGGAASQVLGSFLQGTQQLGQGEGN